MLTQLQVGEFLKTLYNPRYASEDKQGPIALDGISNGSTLIFYASPTDAMDYGRNIYQRAIDGDFGPIAEFEPVAQPEIKNNPIIPQLDLFAEKQE